MGEPGCAVHDKAASLRLADRDCTEWTLTRKKGRIKECLGRNTNGRALVVMRSSCMVPRSYSMTFICWSVSLVESTWN